MNLITWVDEPRHLPRFAAGLATDPTTTGFTEQFIHASGAVESSEIQPDWSRLRLRGSGRDQNRWCNVPRTYDELTQQTEAQAADPEYGVPDNEATTVTFSPRSGEVVVGKASEFAELDPDATLRRGTVPVQHERNVIFAHEVELRIAELPAWKPRIVISPRILEIGDE